MRIYYQNFRLMTFLLVLFPEWRYKKKKKNAFKGLSWELRYHPSPQPFTKLYEWLKPWLWVPKPLLCCCRFLDGLVIIMRELCKGALVERHRGRREKTLRLSLLVTLTSTAFSIYISSKTADPRCLFLVFHSSYTWSCLFSKSRLIVWK